MHGSVLMGKTALVTGSSRALGAVIAERLAEASAKVAITYQTSRSAADELASRLRLNTGINHVVVSGNAASHTEVRDLVNAAVTALGGHCDVLVNNVGPFCIDPLVKLSAEDWEYIWHANVSAAFVASKIVAPVMQSQGWVESSTFPLVLLMYGITLYTGSRRLRSTFLRRKWH